MGMRIGGGPGNATFACRRGRAAVGLPDLNGMAYERWTCECEVCQPEQNGNGANCAVGKGWCIHLGLPQFADLTHASRDAGTNESVTQAVRSTENSGKAESRGW